MPTPIGVLFLIASVYFFFQKNDKLFALVIFSALFHAASVIGLKEAGIEPYYVVGALFALQGVVRGKTGLNLSNSFKGKWWMILFGVIAILSAFTLPFVFAGVPVYEQHVGIDDGLLYRPPLHFANSNMTHSLALLLDILVVLGAAEHFRGKSSAKASYRFTFYFLAGIVFVQFVCSLIGLQFPYSFFQNHAAFGMQSVETGDLGSRFPGTFTESSGAGEVLTGFTVGFLAEYLKFGRSLVPALVGLAMIFLVRSTGALVTIALVLMLLVSSQPIFRWPFHINVSRLKRIWLFVAIGCVVVAAVILSPLRDSLVAMTLEKGETGSFVNRLSADIYAFQLLVRTKGIGVGMGSNRPSSLITSLLSTVGVLGLIVFLLAYFKLLSNSSRNYPELWWAGLALFLNMATSAPDYDAPWHWVFLAFVVQAGRISSSKETSRDGRTVTVKPKVFSKKYARAKAFQPRARYIDTSANEAPHEPHS